MPKRKEITAPLETPAERVARIRAEKMAERVRESERLAREYWETLDPRQR